ncbi:helix-turn-helix domain-containing protein [Dysgonomonas reticulitermitis]
MVTKIPRYRPDKVLTPTGIEIYSFETLYNKKIAKEAIYDYHRASFFHIIRYRGADNFHYIDSKKIKLEKNCLLIVNRDIAQRFPPDRWEGELIVFSASFFGSTQQKADYLNQSLLFQNDFTVVKLQSASFEHIIDMYFSLMMTQFDQEPEIRISLLRNWLHNLLIVIEREFCQQRSLIAFAGNMHYIQQFKSLLDASYAAQKQVSFYAKELNISERKLSRIVLTTYGVTAKGYIAERLMSEAVRLLKNTTLNQGEIALRLGFDLTYFIKFFRRRTGFTPARYRQQQENLVSFVHKRRGLSTGK